MTPTREQAEQIHRKANDAARVIVRRLREQGVDLSWPEIEATITTIAETLETERSAAYRAGQVAELEEAATHFDQHRTHYVVTDKAVAWLRERAERLTENRNE